MIRIAGVILAAGWSMVLGVCGAPSAAAADCPDIEVIFARGTGAPPGAGWLGDAFTNALRSKVGDRSVGLYGVNYPASADFRKSVVVGANDARARVEYMAANCPDTSLVLGGNSQGAGVVDLITLGWPVHGYTPVPIPPDAADHVAAVVVFGNPLRDMPGGGPLSALSPGYDDKTLDLCATDDLFCSKGFSLPAHFSYVDNGMADQAAAFAAGKL